MMSHIEVNVLLDLYGDLLSPKQKQCAEYYYQEDYSLSEIAALLEISRAAVSKNLHSALDTLNNFENTLHLAGLLDSLASFGNQLDEKQAKRLTDLLENWKMQSVSV